MRIQGEGFGARPSSGQRTGRGEGVEGACSWGGVGHSISGSKQPASGRPPKLFPGAQCPPQSGAVRAGQATRGSGAASRNPARCKGTGWFNSGSWEAVGRAEESLALGGASHCPPPDVTSGHSQEPPKTLL